MALQTQLRMPTSTTPATYFHSQNAQQSLGSSYFSAISPSHTKQWKRPLSAQQMRGQNYGMAKKQKEAELQFQSSEKMTALHSRLQQEAEKIRKWKNTTELDIKHKEKCLEEADCTIESQQKLMTELQLNNESLQSQLSEEVANQKEIKAKISSTREMCTALKNHCIKIDAALIKGQEDKDNLFVLNRERLLKYQELSEKYEQLEKGQIECHAKYKDALVTEREQRSETESKCTTLSEDLGKALNKISLLEDQGENDRLLILNLEDKLESMLNENGSLKNERDTLQSALLKNDRDIEMLKETIDSITLELTFNKEHSIKLAQELVETQDVSNKNEGTLLVKVTELELSLASKTSEWMKSRDNLENELTHTMDNLKGAIRDKEDLLIQLRQSEENCQGLQKELKCSGENCTELEVVKDQLKSQLLELRETLAGTVEELKQQTTEKEKDLEKAEKLISDVRSCHKSVHESWLKKEKEMESKMEDLVKGRMALTCEVNVLTNQLNESEAKVLHGIAMNNDWEIKYVEDVRMLTSEIGAVKDENVKLKSQVESLFKDEENLTTQCSDKDKVLMEKLKLVASLEAKATELCQLQDRLLQEKAESSKLNEELMLQNQRLMDEVVASKTNEIDGKQKHDLELTKVKEEMVVRIGELTSLVEKTKKEADTFKMEFIQSKKNCDREVQDLVAALDSYRSEHEKAVAGKDKIIENLKQHMQHSERSKEISEKALKEKVKMLQSEIDVKNEELKNSMESMNQKVEGSESAEVVSTTPSKKKTSNAATRKYNASKVTTNLSTPAGEDKALSAIHNSSCKVSSAVVKTPTTITNTPLHSGHVFRTPAPPTPTRLYNYHIKSTLQLKNKVAQITPRYTGRGKRMHSQYDSDLNSSEDKAKNNTMYGTEDEEVVFKKPKPKNPGVTVQRVSSTTASYSSKAGKRGPGKKQNQDLSWFDVDSVYGFGMNDN